MFISDLGRGGGRCDEKFLSFGGLQLGLMDW